MLFGLAASTMVLFAVVGFLAGVGITAIGPGGVFITIALALTAASPAVVAGTAGATNIAAGLLGTAVYVRSGELRTAAGTRMAVALSVPGGIGALVGKRINALVSAAEFSVLLGAFVVFAGLLTWYRERYGAGRASVDPTTRSGALAVGVVGFAVGVPGGLLGVGGPVLAVPLLIALGVPLLPAVAAAQVQSVFVAAPATAAYLLDGAVSVPLVALIAVPELAGIVVGWGVARRIEPRILKIALGGVLVALGVYLMV
ncbi:sulfite exporter TauE/SafE family protein [Halogeometricum sp. S1BR25-6]|uniref:Probable membrane transporter protein n=1 Tax=Halogeometricum salsisoli TaxID=2950536 RepID=A0ABU2GGW4_9EURY|nr:sulfite exporter TauE/SafE family protein [Halogeometricum sp. S1BR25-6]MDS0300035.1 sulfite exporter TauE/SafE family protein [Halogeometricum sp. S1BR25-6]